MKISKRALEIEPSLGRQLFNMAQMYDDVVDLTLGDPDLKPSDKIRKAACEAIMEGKTRYSANKGLIELRKHIADSFEIEYGLKADPDTDVMVTVGGMEGLYLAIACIIDEGDEVIIQAPYYANYVQMVKMCGGIPKIIYTAEDDGFKITADQLNKALSDKTVALIINTPSNPTGQVLDAKTLDLVADFAIKNNLIVISDEVYRTLIYDEKKYESIITRAGMQHRTVLVDSMSKRYSMTGYRLGYVIASADLVECMSKMQENIAACASLPSQYAAIAAISECSDEISNVREYEKRRDYIVDAINSIDMLSCKKPEATFYLFVNISKTDMNCIDFAYKLLEAQHVAVVPGVIYGVKYSDYIRIAFTVGIEKLKIAVNRISKFIDSIKK